MSEEEEKFIDPETGKRYSDDDLEFSDYARGQRPISPLFAWLYILMIFALIICVAILIF